MAILKHLCLLVDGTLVQHSKYLIKNYTNIVFLYICM